MKNRDALIIVMDTVAKGTMVDSEILNRINHALTNEFSRDENLDFNVETIGNSNINPKTIEKIIFDFFKKESNTLLLYIKANDNNTEIIFTEDARVSYFHLMQAVSESKSKNTIVVLDTLHSNDGINLLTDNRHLTKETTLLISSDSENKSKGYIPFTEHLLEALEGQAANVEGYITMASLYSYIDSVLDEESQRPTYIAHVKGFLPICKTKSRVDQKLANLNNITKHFPNKDFKFPLDPSYEEKRNPGEEGFAIPKPENVKRFKELQEFVKLGLVEPCSDELNSDECHMYFAAIQSKHCQLTALGKAYHAKYSIKQEK